MKAGQERYQSRLRRGIRQDGGASLYVKRRTSKRGGNRVLVVLPASVRYALCTWASYRTGVRSKAVSQELQRLLWEAIRRRLGPDAEAILEDAYEAYTKQCADRGEPNIFEAVTG